LLCGFANADEPDIGFVCGFLYGIFGLIGFGLAIAFYFLPYYFAKQNNKKNKTAIGILNFFLGWTIIGWVIALVWAHIEE
jgi:hypothetical protein